MTRLDWYEDMLDCAGCMTDSDGHDPYNFIGSRIRAVMYETSRDDDLGPLSDDHLPEAP